jgi:hypothetical protein
MRIFLPAGVFAVICALYTGYWFWAADRMEGLVNEWAVQQREAGATVSWSSLKVRGWPFRLEAHMEKPVIRTRDWAWKGDSFLLHMMPYSFSHYIGTFEGTHRLRLGGADAERPLVFEGEAALARASLVLESRDAMRVSVDLKGLTAQRLDTERGPVLTRFAAERLQVHLRQWLEKDGPERPSGANLAVAVQADNADIPGHGLKGLGPVVGLARGQVLLTELPIEIAGDPGSLADYLRSWESNGGKAQFEGFDLRWDRIDVSASGRMALDGEGRPQGEIDTRISDHAAVLDVLTSNELMQGKQAEMANGALAALGMVSRGKDGRLKLPVKLKKGEVWLGPVKLSKVEPVY